MEVESMLAQKDAFSASVTRAFTELAGRGMEPNEACALALKVAAGVAALPPSAADLRAAVSAAAAADSSGPGGASAASSDARHASVAAAALAFFGDAEAVHAAFWTRDDECTRQQQPGAGSSSSSGDAAGEVSAPPGWRVDMDELCGLYDALLSLKSSRVVDALGAAARQLLQHAEGCATRGVPHTALQHHVAALLTNPVLEEVEGHPEVERLASYVTALPSPRQEALVDMVATWAAPHLSRAVRMLHSYITLALFSRQAVTPGVEATARLLALLHRANTRSGALPYSEFYNDAVNSDDFNVKEDFRRWRSGTQRYPFSFCRHPFMYDPAAKARILQLENTMSQFQEFESSMWSAVMGGGGAGACPYLVLRVRRGANLLSDTLQQVHRAAGSGALRKPLKVQFVGEEGVDEGGVQKEFFQLLVREAFRPDYGMFAHHDGTRLYWFRGSSLDLDLEYELIGILIGLAIYNSHILDFSFPLVLYKKLQGYDKYTLEDLAELQPEVAASLRQLLTMDEASLAALELTFQVETEGIGERAAADLAPEGAALRVTPSNVRQYVDAYVRHILHTSAERQFGAFRRGFLRLCSGAALQFFRPAELEQLVCGGRHLDLDALEAATMYEDGYTATSSVVVWFWQVVHALDEARQKQLLFFITGSDRVPIKGLAHLSPPFVISRNGPHSERLPTAHTCFNHLLLPAYKDKRTLERLLLLAIENGCEGFGLV